MIALDLLIALGITYSNMLFQQDVFSAERIGDLRIGQVMSLAEQCAGPLMRGWEVVEVEFKIGDASPQ